MTIITILDFSCGKIFQTEVPKNTTCTDAEILLHDVFKFNLDEISYMIHNVDNFGITTILYNE